MKTYPYKEAKAMIKAICEAAAAGQYNTREKFIAMLDQNPHIAVQGYNPHGKIFYWNEASAHVYGHSEAVAVNQELYELILPPEMRNLARDMVKCALKTGKMPEASACDLVCHNGEMVTVYSGHLIFQWGNASPEIYCIDLPLEAESGIPKDC